MKKITIILLLCALCLTACAPEPTPSEETTGIQDTPGEGLVQMANPWMGYASLSEAESASGLDFPLPEEIAGVYRVGSVMVMNGSLLEVRYQQDGTENEITVRMCAGEGQDISGVYDTFDSVTEAAIGNASVTMMQNKTSALCLITDGSHSYSIYTSTNDQIPQEFLDQICSA